MRFMQSRGCELVNSKRINQRFCFLRKTQTKPRTVGSLVEHRAVMREVVSSTQAGPTLRVLNNWVESAAFVIKSANG